VVGEVAEGFGDELRDVLEELLRDSRKSFASRSEASKLSNCG
jgi:hypothetical protein